MYFKRLHILTTFLLSGAYMINYVRNQHQFPFIISYIWYIYIDHHHPYSRITTMPAMSTELPKNKMYI